MSLIEKVTAPFKFVENELEVLAGSLFNYYNNKTGKSIYSLANIYADGATVYLISAYILPKGLTFNSVASSLGQCYVLYFLHRQNSAAEKLEDYLLKSSEGVKSQELKDWKKNMKSMGRVFFFLGTNIVLEKVTGYSIFHFSRQTGIELSDIFSITYSTLFTLSGYTAAIDYNSPKKSRAVSFLKGLIPQKAPELSPIPKKVNY